MHHMFFYKEIQLILSRIEFSLLVRLSTTLPLSHVPPWGNELPTPAIDGHLVQPYTAPSAPAPLGTLPGSRGGPSHWASRAVAQGLGHQGASSYLRFFFFFIIIKINHL